MQLTAESGRVVLGTEVGHFAKYVVFTREKNTAIDLTDCKTRSINPMLRRVKFV